MLNKNQHPPDTTCANFQAKQTTQNSPAQICPNIGIWGLNFKNLSPKLELAPPKYHLCKFSVKMDNFEFFGPHFEKLSNYVQYFGSNNVEGVAESWVEVEKSWVEVDGAACTVQEYLITCLVIPDQ